MSPRGVWHSHAALVPGTGRSFDAAFLRCGLPGRWRPNIPPKAARYSQCTKCDALAGGHQAAGGEEAGVRGKAKLTLSTAVVSSVAAAAYVTYTGGGRGGKFGFGGSGGGGGSSNGGGGGWGGGGESSSSRVTASASASIDDDSSLVQPCVGWLEEVG